MPGCHRREGSGVELMSNAISPRELKRLLDQGADVEVIDVRLIEDRTPVEHPIPGAAWRNPDEVAKWFRDIDAGQNVVVYCVHGHRVSQGVCATLRSNGIGARFLEEGIAGWEEMIRSGSTRSGE